MPPLPGGHALAGRFQVPPLWPCRQCLAYGRDLWLCAGCRRQTSVTAGTLFEKTRKPLRDWFLAIWEVTSQKYGASALGIQRVLGLRSYETAWAWLHKLRRAMVRPDRDRLLNEVEVDETYVGGEEAGVSGRETVSKAIVAVALELREEKIARIRLAHVPDVSAESLVGFIVDVVAPGSTVRTDGWNAYEALTAKGFKHRRTVLSASPDPAHVLMPGVHRVAALLKPWWLGPHHGAISIEHLTYYLDEFTFRSNRRTSRSRGLLFYRLLEQAVRTEHVDTDALFRNTGRGRSRFRRRSIT